MSGSKTEWIRPDEFLKIQRKQLKKLQQRLVQQSSNTTTQQTGLPNKPISQKRNNPFVKHSEINAKRTRQDLPTASEDTLFELLHGVESKASTNIEASIQEVLPVFSNNTDLSTVDDDDDHLSDEEVPKAIKTLPLDWSIKSRVRIISKSLVVSSNLKSTEEASGMTGFVRCLDLKSSSSRLEISNGARFHQNLMYWQYPHLPWLNLIQRNSSSNNQFKMNDPEAEALHKHWMECFRNLFQLLRALQCPYFYVICNQFNVLFRAAGIGGRSEMHALVTPTTRGYRKALKEEDIEFIQPMKETTINGESTNASLENSNHNENKDPEADDEDEEEDEMKFLESLGVDSSDITFKDDITARKKEIEDDNGDMSTTLIEGVDCHSFFSFLLNSKSIVPKVGRLAGIPPTLLAPVAFLGGSMCKQTARSSKIRVESEDFYSIELRGAILPHTVHTLCALLSEVKDKYSLTMVNYPHTVAFTKTSRKILGDLERKLVEDPDKKAAIADVVFWCENLSDCGLNHSVLESMCRVDADAVNILESVQFHRENGGYTLL